MLRTQVETLDAPALSAEARTALIEAEVTYQVARAELAAAEEARYARIWSAYLALNRDRAALMAEAPSTITRGTLAAAARRHAPASEWEQPELFDFEP